MTKATRTPEPDANFLGIGLYTPEEAGLYARIPTQTVSRWIYGAGESQPVFDPAIARSERLITFPELIQTMAIRSIRLTKKVPLDKIREGVRVAEERFGLSYPLARPHTIYLMGDEVLVNVGSADQKKLIQATGKHKDNLVIASVAEHFMKDVFFDGATGLARWYVPMRQDDLEVRLDPKFHFGEPLVPSCGYTAKSLWDAYRIEGGITEAAKAYGVQVAEVELACRFYDHYLPKSAA